MAVACGLCAGANYFNQPLLHSIAVHLQVSEGTAALTVTFAQVAYAVGLLLLVPLGDKLERRRLIATLMVLAAAGLFLSGFADRFALLALGTLMTGLFSVAAQVLVPMAAALAAPGRSGQAVGLVMSGLLTGILAARSVAGLLSGLGREQLTTRVSVLLVLASWAALWLGGTSIAWFLVGMLAIDLALQGVHISNQNVIYQLAPEARSRLNAVYMTTYFTGAALGSALGSAAWQRGGWSAACLAGVGVAGLNALAMVHDARLARGTPAPAAPPA
ncbi:MFS transporter [Acidovorax sp. SUPP2825]|uniref:MFS transporter n=1 Tax=Acidovorax sp. SUPP2825 TaxID=2920879 RepID=UPI0024E12E25|nr:MFS transporter [Acidovorax sp. SUPP2825]